MKTVEYTHAQHYNKTLVVGYTLSDHAAVMALLNAGGMSIAKPLRHQSIEATDISKILSQAYYPTGAIKEQLRVDKVWDGLALDLFMSNRDQKWWGWADSDALPYLDYWKSIDSKLGFIFVYDTPESFIKQVLSQSDELSAEAVAKSIDEWCAYNEALLKFYYRNTERSLLVNTQQVKLRTTEYLQQVSKQIGFNHAKIDDNALVTIQKTFENDEHEPLFSYLINDVLRNYPNITNVFEELQSVADLPYNDPVDEVRLGALDALLVLQNDKEEYAYLQEKMASAQKENEAYQSHIARLESKQKELFEIEKTKTSENEELIAELMSVQEELEKYYLTSQENTKKLASIEKNLEEKQKTNEELKSKLDSLQKKYNDLTQVEKSKTFENEELLAQLMSVQEELEKYYLENKRLKEKQEEAQRYYGAAERVKKQLRYRVGKEITHKYKSIFGILSLPFSLILVYRNYKKDKKKMAEEKLPPISKYADAYDVPRIKRHHAYRVGDVVISSLQQSPFGVFAVPYRLIKLYREFKKERNDA